MHALSSNLQYWPWIKYTVDSYIPYSSALNAMQHAGLVMAAFLEVLGNNLQRPALTQRSHERQAPFSEAPTFSNHVKFGNKCKDVVP